MPQRKKAGCNSYASVTDEYTLYNKEASAVVAPSAPPTTTKGGVRRRGGSSFTNTVSSMSPPFGLDTATFSQGMQSLLGTSDATPTPPPQNPPVTGGNRRSKRGGSSSCSATRYGGFYEEVVPSQQGDGLDTVANMLTNTTKSVSDSLFGTDTAKTGGSRHRRGGAVELAPFAASLAFLAARMSMDDKLNFSKLLNLKNNKDDETDEEVEYEETKSKGSRSKNSRD